MMWRRKRREGWRGRRGERKVEGRGGRRRVEVQRRGEGEKKRNIP